MKQFLLSVFLVFWAAGMVSPLFQPARGQSTPAVLRIEPSEIEIGEGQVQSVQVWVEGISELYGFEAHLAFDPGVMEVVDSDPSREGIQVQAGGFLKADFIVLNMADNEAGSIELAYTQINPSPPASGAGALATIQLRGKTRGSETGLAALDSDLAVVTGPQQVGAAEFTWQDGMVRVVAPLPTAPTLTFTSTPTLTSTPSPTRTPRPEVQATQPEVQPTQPEAQAAPPQQQPTPAWPTPTLQASPTASPGAAPQSGPTFDPSQAFIPVTGGGLQSEGKTGAPSRQMPPRPPSWSERREALILRIEALAANTLWWAAMSMLGGMAILFSGGILRNLLSRRNSGTRAGRRKVD